MGSRQKNPFPRGLSTSAGILAVSLVLLTIGLVLEALGLRHGDKLIFVALLMLLTFTAGKRR